MLLANLKLTNVMGVPDFYSSSSKDLTNFTFIPDLIRWQLYHFDNTTIKYWCEKDFLTKFLVSILPMKALGGGFDLVDEDEKPFAIWENTWKPELQRTDFWKSFCKTFVYGYQYGMGILHFDEVVEQFEVIPGSRIQKIEVDAFNTPTNIILNPTQGQPSPPLDMDYTYWVRNEGEDEPKGRSYLEDIFDILVYIKWIYYSMCEQSAGEGSGFFVMGLKNPKPGQIARAQEEVVGLSARKGLIVDIEAMPPAEMKRLDVNHSPIMPLHISECYKALALKTSVPEDILTGIHAYRSGGETNVGSLYEAYSQIQNQAKDALITILCKMFKEKREVFAKLKFVFHDQQRMGELQEEQLKFVKAQRINLEMQYKLLSEIREAEGLPVSEQMKMILPPSMTRGITLTVKGLEPPPMPGEEQEEDEEKEKEE